MFTGILEDIWRSTLMVKQLSIMFIVKIGSITKRGSCKRYCSSEAAVPRCFDFIATLVLTRSILDITLPVPELLQGKEIDMADASHLLNSLKSVTVSKSNIVGEFNNNCYRIILEIANKEVLMKLNLVQLHFKKIATMLPQNQYLIVFKKLQLFPYSIIY